MSSTVRSTASRNRAIVRYDSNDSADSSDRQSAQASKRHKNDELLDENSIDRIVADCVRYLLFVDHKKTPVKRVDLFKAVAKQSPNRKTCDQIIKIVRSELSKNFGIELAECPETANTYILVNKLPAEGLTEAIPNESLPDRQTMISGLLSTVLAVIFMSGQTLHEDRMWKFLKKLGIDVNSKTQTLRMNDDGTGITYKKLLTELWVRQLYLKYQKIPRSDPMAHEFKWGFRAEKEFNKLAIIRFVCKVFADDSQPEFWRSQYAVAVEEGQAGQTDPINGNEAQGGGDAEQEVVEMVDED